MSEETKVSPPVKKAPTIDWEKAEEHLKTVERSYLEIMGLPGVNVMFFFISTLPPIRGAFNKGIRTKELYNEIMELE